ncbi:MAG: hypothetical protein RLZ02_877 [Actinomycetota bacterium]
MGITATDIRPSRISSLDVTRALALVGVVVMNYHAYLNKSAAFYPERPSFAERIFNPLSGILTTRFAATFVLVAGMGIALLVQPAIRSENATLIRATQMKLARRGLFLYAVGAAVQWIWPGTILFYYGAFFLIAAVICTWSNRSLLAVSAVSIAVSTGLTAWRGYRSFEGDFTQWLSPTPNSPRNLLIRTFFDYTHPVFPWITFICAGIILGRNLQRLAQLRKQIMVWSGVTLLVTYFIRTFAMPDSIATRTDYVLQRVLSTNNHDHALLHVTATLAVALLAFCIISLITDSQPMSRTVTFLARTGQMTLSIYLAHVLVFNLVVHWLNWVRPTGLDTALVLSLSFYVVAVPVSSLCFRRFGIGPCERVYRAFGG